MDFVQRVAEQMVVGEAKSQRGGVYQSARPDVGQRAIRRIARCAAERVAGRTAAEYAARRAGACGCSRTSVANGGRAAFKLCALQHTRRRIAWMNR